MTFGPTRRDGLTSIDGGVTAAPGYRAGGVRCGIKPSGDPDMALVASDAPAQAAATLTSNHFRAAPCQVTARHVADGNARVVVLNSGNANAGTGEQGRTDARLMCASVADKMGCQGDEVLVCSTGVIGEPLDRGCITAGVADVVEALDADGGGASARAILTTDTVTKESAYRVENGGRAWTVGGMAKGAGMIEPNMATMLAVITTDAPLTAADLRQMLDRAVSRTFNRISVDACGSTNDTVIALANGEVPEGDDEATDHDDRALLSVALEAVCADLARAIVADGEGATRIGHVQVTGARWDEEAVEVARAIASSVLVRSALYSGDPNWGRILAAMGTASAPIDPDSVTVRLGPASNPDAALTFFQDGEAAGVEVADASAALAHDEVLVDVDLGLGSAEATFLTADLSPQYVEENAHYTT